MVYPPPQCGRHFNDTPGPLAVGELDATTLLSHCKPPRIFAVAQMKISRGGTITTITATHEVRGEVSSAVPGVSRILPNADGP